jgi:hypothetical protein
MNHTDSLRWRIALLIAAAIAISYFDIMATFVSNRSGGLVYHGSRTAPG